MLLHTPLDRWPHPFRTFLQLAKPLGQTNVNKSAPGLYIYYFLVCVCVCVCMCVCVCVCVCSMYVCFTLEVELVNLFLHAQVHDMTSMEHIMRYNGKGSVLT